MAHDDKESNGVGPSRADGQLSPRVVEALEKARNLSERLVQEGPANRGGGSRFLALVPVSAAVLMLLLMMPRAAVPSDLPMPRIDMRAISATRDEDHQRAEHARQSRLSGDILLVGTSLRALNKAMATNATDEDVSIARLALENAVRTVRFDGDASLNGLLSLRAVQLESFLSAVVAFENTSTVSDELDELAGGFLERMGAAGWLEGSHVILDDAERRAAFKMVWTATVGGEQWRQLAPTLDEQRVLYSFYLRRPHAPEAQRASTRARREAATSSVACERAVADERLAAEHWRLEKVSRLSEIDPTYPAAYALGVAYFKAGRYDASAASFRSWIDSHPEGPLALRARNHLKAALSAY